MRVSRMGVRGRKAAKKAPGSAPGSLVHVGERRQEEPRLSLVTYDHERLEETVLGAVSELDAAPAAAVRWINLEGIHETSVVETLGSRFDLHPLLLEDVLNTNQRPKIELYEEHLFCVLKMLDVIPEKNWIETEQVSLVLGRDYLISFQEVTGDVFDPIRTRLRSGRGRIRGSGADYLFYALLDSVVDHYFIALESLEDRIELLETEVLERPSEATLQSIRGLKNELILVRRSIWPLRDSVVALARDEPDLISDKTRIYLRDVHDHLVQAFDTLESLRDSAATLLDMYLSTSSNRMNEVMKVLTVIATIFIPLTFIAGVYGMNFQNMPELEVAWAYPAVWAVMILVAVALLFYFRRRGWI